jgi:hypothetical protein
MQLTVIFTNNFFPVTATVVISIISRFLSYYSDTGVKGAVGHFFCLKRLFYAIRDIQNYWGSGLCPSSRILKTRKLKLSETESVNLLR